jgi:hypothetical protein
LPWSISSDGPQDHLDNNATIASRTIGTASFRVNGNGSRRLIVGGVKDDGGRWSEEIHW